MYINYFDFNRFILDVDFDRAENLIRQAEFDSAKDTVSLLLT
jgi:hypothetical protein